MILVTGGAQQGKWAFCREQLLKVKTHYVDGHDAGVTLSFPPEAEALAFNYIHVWLEQHLDEEEQLRQSLKQLLSEAGTRPLIFICADECCGLVPMEAKQRRYREQLGRLLQDLAAEACSVYRLFAGCALALKENEEARHAL